MKDYFKSGEIFEFTAGADLVSGQFVKVGSLFGCVVETAATGAKAQLRRFGHYVNAPKADSQAWTVGVLLYWDDTNKVFTTTSSGNTKVGAAAAAVANTAGLVTGEVILIPAI